jgi:hypothetical protein
MRCAVQACLRRSGLVLLKCKCRVEVCGALIRIRLQAMERCSRAPMRHRLIANNCCTCSGLQLARSVDAAMSAIAPLTEH